MEEDRGTKRVAGPAEQAAGAEPAEQPPHSPQEGPPSGSGLNWGAKEFVPRWQGASRGLRRH